MFSVSLNEAWPVVGAFIVSPIPAVSAVTRDSGELMQKTLVGPHGPDASEAVEAQRAEQEVRHRRERQRQRLRLAHRDGAEVEDAVEQAAQVRPVSFGIGTGVPLTVRPPLGAFSAIAAIAPSGLPGIVIRLVPTVTPPGRVSRSDPSRVPTVTEPVAPVVPSW